MRTINILLADDDPGHRYLLSRVIVEKRSFVRMTSAKSLEEFTESLNGQTYDCAVLDFNFSDCVHADDLAKQLWQVQPECPIIVVSGSKAQDVAIRSFRCGSADFIHKDEAVKRGVLWSRIKRVIVNRTQNVAERRKRQRREDRLREIAETDALTGLCNRHAIDRLFSDGERSILDRRAEASVIMLDIDHFKSINDTHGHAEGDRVLRELGSLMRQLATDRDVVARWGGEEFLVIRPRTDLVTAVRWADTLRCEFHRKVQCGADDDGGVTASLGVYTVKSTNLSKDSIERADEAMYQAKRRGRNRVCTWGASQFESAIPDDAGMAPEHRLQKSLECLLPSLGPTQREYLTSHSSGVSTAAMLVGMSANLDSGALDVLRIAGLCHDIGKVSVPEGVLAKSGPLSESERFVLNMHADDSAFLSEQLGVVPAVSAMVRESRHRFDDSRGQPADLPTSMLAVADAYVAMTSNRSYGRKHTNREAIDELKRESGSRFDPRAVDACAACYGE